jgi:hypothetical protein
MKAIIVLLLLLGNTVLYAQECDCKKKVDSVTAYLRKNYVGFIDKVNPVTQQSYLSLLAKVSTQASTARSYAHCLSLIHNYLRFFKDQHLFIIPAFTPGKEAINLLPAQLELLDKLPAGSVAGYYQSDSLKVALLKQPKGIRSYAAVVLPPGTASWRPNEVIFELVARGGDKFDIINYADWNKHPFDSLVINRQRNELAKLGWSPRGASNVHLAATAPAFPDVTAQGSYFRLLSDSLGYLRISSMRVSDYDAIDSVLNANDEHIRKDNRLIIDIRGCDSGSYKIAERLRPILYTQPVRIIGEDFFATPDNLAAWRQLLEAQTNQLPDEYVEQLKEVLQQSAGLQGRLVSMGPDENMILPTPLLLPEKVAILIDGTCREAAELFLLEAKQSQKVKLFGSATAGVSDYGHATNVKFFSPNFFLSYPVTRSRRVAAKQGIDNKGIMPDFTLDYSKEEWINEVIKNF